MIPCRGLRPLLIAIGVFSLAGCAVDSGGYGYGYNGDLAFDGGYYGPDGYDYGGWGPDYYVGPYRDGHGHDHGGHDGHDGGGHDNNGGNGPHAYRAPAGGHGTPSIPSQSHGGGGGGHGGGGGGGGGSHSR